MSCEDSGAPKIFFLTLKMCGLSIFSGIKWDLGD